MEQDKDGKEAAAFSELVFSTYNEHVLSTSVIKNCLFDINKVSEYKTQVVAGLKSSIKFSLTSPKIDDASCNNLFCEAERVEVLWQEIDSLKICCVKSTVECGDSNTLDYNLEKGAWSSLDSEKEASEEGEAGESAETQEEKSIDESVEGSEEEETQEVESATSVNKYKAYGLLAIVLVGLGAVYYIRKAKEASLRRAAAQPMNDF